MLPVHGSKSVRNGTRVLVVEDDPEERRADYEAAERLADAGEIRRVRERGDPDGRVYWLRPDVHQPAPEG